MVKSMTAFGRSRFSLGGRVYILEIHSVNRKGLEISLNLPTELAFLEIFLRNTLKSVCLRGQVSCKILSDSSNTQKISADQLKLIHQKLTTIAKEIDSTYHVTFDHLLEVALRGSGVIDMEEKEVEKVVEKALDDAVADFLSMRKREGEMLEEDISDRLIQIGKTCHKIMKKGEGAPAKMKERIVERLNEAMKIDGEDSDRLLREAIIFADKCDVTEEMTRMRSHVDQMQGLLKGKEKRKEEAVGRTLEFFLQEMQREINTTGAKSQDLELISEVIFVKRELEKIREQVQNIE